MASLSGFTPNETRGFAPRGSRVAALSLTLPSYPQRLPRFFTLPTGAFHSFRLTPRIHMASGHRLRGSACHAASVGRGRRATGGAGAARYAKGNA